MTVQKQIVWKNAVFSRREAIRAACLGAAVGLLPGRSLAADDMSWPETIVIGTAGKGGVYDAYGRGLADLLSREVHIAAVAQETGGAEDNVRLLAEGAIQIGFTTLSNAFFDAKDANGEPRPAPQHIEALAPMYETAFHFVVPARSRWQSLKDFHDAKIGVGPKGGTTAYYVPRILKSVGADGTFVEGAWDKLGRDLAAGNLDLLAVAGGTPFPALLDLSRTVDLRFLPVDDGDALKVHLNNPELARTRVPVGIYPWEKQPYGTLGLFNFIVVTDRLPHTLVTAILDALFSNRNHIVDFTPMAAETVPRNYDRNAILPFHPAAARWFLNHAGTLSNGD